MMSMVERVARAIEKAGTQDNWKMAAARAAIEAMRDPTDAMLYHMDGYSDLVGPYPEANTKEERLKEFSCAYRAAIDAALNEQVAG